jgi:hypothetical protein
MQTDGDAFISAFEIGENGLSLNRLRQTHRAADWIEGYCANSEVAMFSEQVFAGCNSLFGRKWFMGNG